MIISVARTSSVRPRDSGTRHWSCVILVFQSESVISINDPVLCRATQSSTAWQFPSSQFMDLAGKCFWPERTQCFASFQVLKGRNALDVGGNNKTTVYPRGNTSFSIVLIETMTTTNTLSKDYLHPDANVKQITDTPEFKPFTIPTSTFNWYNPLFYLLRRRRSTLVLTATSISSLIKKN